MSRCTLLTLFFVIILSKSLYGQHIIQGSVTDSLSKPIPFVQVLLYDSTQTGIYGFTQADSLGRYELVVEKNGKYNLTFNILSHKSKTIPIDLFENTADSLLIINVILPSRSYKLEEVVVETERSITVRGDTIAMKVDDFRRGDEEVVEDVLSKLPGIEVDDDGTIRFAGKQISKVMVEGSDLFGKGYSMLTKNLDANTIDEVEVLQNYLEEQELKGLAQSDEVALNLNLKDDVKLNFFGNASLGINSLSNHEGRLVLTSLNKKTKQFIILNSNSIGKDAFGDLDRFRSSGNTLELSSDLAEMEINPWKSFGSYSLPLDAQRMRFNNSGLASYNLFLSPNEDFEFKLVGVGVFDKDNLNKETRSIFYTENEVVRQLESQSFKNQLHNGLGKVTSFFKPNTGSKVEYIGSINYGNTDARTDAYTFNNDLFQDYQNNHREMDHLIRYSNRINKDNALIVNSHFLQEKMKQKLFLEPSFAGDIFGIGTDSYEVDQQGTINFKSLQVNSLWLKRLSNKFSLEVTGSSSVAHLNNSLLFHLNRNDTNSTDIEGTNNYNNQLDVWIQGAGVLGRFALGTINIYSGVKTHYLNIDYKNTAKELRESEKLLIKPEVGFDYQFSSNKVQMSYSYDVSVSSISHLNDGYRFYDNRTLEQGLGKAHTFRGHNLFARYTYGGWLRRKMFHATFIYNRNDGAIANNSEITGEYSLIRRTLDTDREIYFTNVTGDFLLPGLQNNLQISGNYTYRSEGSFINDQFYMLKTQVKGYGIDLRSVFDGYFNYTLGASWLHQDLNTGSKRLRSKQFQYTDIYFDLSKTMKFQFVAEREVIKHKNVKNTIYLLDAFFHLKLKPNKLDCSLAFRNILNKSHYVTNSLDGLTFYSSRYDLIPRNVLISLKYRL